MTRVLDIDLDFFLTDVCPFAPEGERPPDDCARPWTAQETRAFLTRNLLLDGRRPVPGRVFETHEGALFFWRDLMRAGLLTPPFSVTHVDAHTDLGVAQRGYPFVRHSVLSRPVASRANIDAFLEMKQLNEANYLMFALAFRWVGALENLRIPASKPDMPAGVLTPDSAYLHLESAFPSLFEARYGAEPLVPYREYSDGRDRFADAPFDFVSLAMSPRYAPRAADALTEVFQPFFTPF